MAGLVPAGTLVEYLSSLVEQEDMETWSNSPGCWTLLGIHSCYQSGQGLGREGGDEEEAGGAANRLK